MANIQPNSTILLLKNVPLDKTYDHTIYFTNATDQANYFSGLAKYTLNNYTYVRQDRRLKVQAPVGSNLYDCNYMMFKNTSFENKWFYAFVTHVEYDNNLTWFVDFELDVMQTWFFDYELEQCFVEREHSATDEIGDNLVPEKFDLGEYVSNGIEHCTTASDGDENDVSYLRNLSLVIACTFDDQMNDYFGGYYCGMYSGLYYYTLPLPDDQSTTADIDNFLNTVHTFLQTASTKREGIITAFVTPTTFIGDGHSNPTPRQFTKTTTFSRIFEDGVDGQGNKRYYIPNNKKLYTYPYNFLYCTNFQGQNIAYMYEYFADPTHAIFELEGNFTPDPSVILAPMSYKGVSGTEPNFDEKMVLSGYPQLPFATDVFSAWLAQSAGSTLISGFTTALTMMVGGALVASGVGAPAGAGILAGAGAGMIGKLALVSGAGAVGNAVAQGWKADYAPPTAHSGAGSISMASQRLLDYGFMRKHIRTEFAKIIDNYFDMYGYAQHIRKVPNRAVRPHWTYTKTIGCCAKGSVPADDMATICGIYDKGITFWRNGNEIGNYNLPNAPVQN